MRNNAPLWFVLKEDHVLTRVGFVRIVAISDHVRLDPAMSTSGD
jgi:hypothetical protein